jgi:hypothetical protein
MRYQVLKEFAISHDKKFAEGGELEDKDLPADKLQCALGNGWVKPVGKNPIGFNRNKTAADDK